MKPRGLEGDDMARRMTGWLLPVVVAIGSIVGCSQQVGEPQDEHSNALVLQLPPHLPAYFCATHTPWITGVGGIVVPRTSGEPLSCPRLVVGSAVVNGVTATDEIAYLETLVYPCRPTFAQVLAGVFPETYPAIARPGAPYCVYANFDALGGPNPSVEDLSNAASEQIPDHGTITNMYSVMTETPGPGQCPSCGRGAN